MKPSVVGAEDSDSDSDVDLAFAFMDFQNVNFDDVEDDTETPQQDRAENAIELPDGGEKDIPVIEAVSIPVTDVPPVDVVPTKKDVDEREQHLLDLEMSILLNNHSSKQCQTEDAELTEVHAMVRHIQSGDYLDVLVSPTSADLLRSAAGVSGSVTERIQTALREDVTQDENADVTHVRMLRWELMGVAFLNLFLQQNYTGPSIDRDYSTATQNIVKQLVESTATRNIVGQVHELLEPLLDEEETHTINPPTSKDETEMEGTRKNRILSELVVDGEWPCQIVVDPVYLLLARAILTFLSDTALSSTRLRLARLWCARSATTHQRLLYHPTTTLWTEVNTLYTHSLQHTTVPSTSSDTTTILASMTNVEFGLAHLHFNQPHPEKWFHAAKAISGLSMDVTGKMGVRTKYQTKPTAQMTVVATSKDGVEDLLNHAVYQPPITKTGGKTEEEEGMTIRGLQHGADSILLEQVRYVDDDVTEVHPAIETRASELSPTAEDGVLPDDSPPTTEPAPTHDTHSNTLTVLDQTILLSLCLDVKAHNPHNDALTHEEMTAYLERLLLLQTNSSHSSVSEEEYLANQKSDKEHQCDDWMVYSTALLERAWLECEGTHSRERAILQIQALVDQHTNRFTLTQSTYESIESSAPVQQRLHNLHSLVYPSQYSIKRDLGERYAKMGIVSTAAELFLELELYNDAIECYRIAGKQTLATELVQKRLEKGDKTPRMYAALGDLTGEIHYYETALELSNGKYSAAYVSLGSHYLANKTSSAAASGTEEKETETTKPTPNDEKALTDPSHHLRLACYNFHQAVECKHLLPEIWFKLGVIHMRLSEWDEALFAFSEVVQQEPEEADAWANVAAIHMRKLRPEMAYPALNESLKRRRSNWRVWQSKLYTCIDLKKYDEAVQACQTLLEFRNKKNQSEKVPPLEEKCVRGIVGGSLSDLDDALRVCLDVSAEAAKCSSTDKTEDQKDDIISGTDSAEDKNQRSKAALDSAKRTIERVNGLLKQLSSSRGSSASDTIWLLETIIYFHQRIGKPKSVILEDYMKLHRTLQAVNGWEKDLDLVKKVCDVALEISDLHMHTVTADHDGSNSVENSSNRESLIKCRYLLNRLVSKIATGYVDDQLGPEEVQVLKTKMAEVQRMIDGDSTIR